MRIIKIIEQIFILILLKKILPLILIKSTSKPEKNKVLLMNKPKNELNPV